MRNFELVLRVSALRIRTRTGVVPPLPTRETLAAWTPHNASVPGHVDGTIRENTITLSESGQGGHTAEMLNLLAALQIDRFKPRHYIAAATDNMSLEKTKVLENSLLEKLDDDATVGIKVFSRISPAILIVGNVIVADKIFEVLSDSTSRQLHFSIYDKYLIQLERYYLLLLNMVF